MRIYVIGLLKLLDYVQEFYIIIAQKKGYKLVKAKNFRIIQTENIKTLFG